MASAPSPIGLESTVQRSTKPVSATVSNEVVLMNLERGRCYGLGEIGTDLWEKLSQPVQVSDLLTTLKHEYAADPAILERDLLDVLAQYAAEGLIEVR